MSALRLRLGKPASCAHAFEAAMSRPISFEHFPFPPKFEGSLPGFESSGLGPLSELRISVACCYGLLCYYY